jgi:1,4-alpha-glucan branching enzyme
VAPIIGRRPIIVAPYDAELFGHWWYEGPEFLNFVFRKIHREGSLEPITPFEYLRLYPVNQVAAVSASSWGHMGFSEVWLDESNDWIYRHLHKASDRMCELADGGYDTGALARRALNQAARELLLAQSSDWAFIMKTDTMAPYAQKRTKEHLMAFTRLYEEIVGETIDEAALADLESRDNLFPDLSYEVYQARAADGDSVSAGG